MLIGRVDDFVEGCMMGTWESVLACDIARVCHDEPYRFL